MNTERGRLAALLRAVDSNIVRLGLREHIDVQRLLEGEHEWDREELADSLAALLGTNESQLDEIRRQFNRFFPIASEPESACNAADPQQPANLPVDGPRGWVGRWLTSPVRLTSRRTAVALAVLLLALGGAFAVATRWRATPHPQVTSSSLPPTSARAAPPSLSTAEPRAPPRLVAHTRPGTYRPSDGYDWVLLVAMGLPLLALGIRWLMLPRAVREQRRRSVTARLDRVRNERRRLAEEGARRGDPLYLPYRVPVHLPMRESVLDDVAFVLGRVGARTRGSNLDVERTLNSTLHEGGRLVPVFEMRGVPSEILVLVDREREDGVWLGGIRRVLDRLERAGVALQRYTFQHVPSVLIPQRAGPPIRIEDLARRFGAVRLLVISRRLSAMSRLDVAPWTAHLAEWPFKAWIDPDPRPLDERRADRRGIEALVQLGLRRFPWSEMGLLAMARYLATGEDDLRGAGWSNLPSLDDPAVARAIEKWALCAALVPDATWDQLEAIRRHPEFRDLRAALPEPACMQRLLEWVAVQTNDDPESGDGRTLQLPEDLVDRLVRKFRELEAESPVASTLEARARKLLLDQLGPNPPEGRLRQLRWELKVASHRLVLEPDRAVQLVGPFFGTAVEEEATSIVQRELRRQSVGHALGGHCVRRDAIARLRALTGEIALVGIRDLLRGYRRISAVALLWAAMLVATTILLTRLLRNDIFGDLLFRTAPTTVKVTLPATYVEPPGATEAPKERAP